jgi:hypothetical protein
MIKSNYTPPDTIFKFVCPEILIKILDNSSLNFTPPNSFNDPYDCYLGLISFAVTQKAIDRIKNDRTISDEIKVKMLKDLEENPHELPDALNQITNDLLLKSGITCFSLKRENMLMWSHYAHKHTGACIEFNSIPLLSRLDSKINVNEVKYINEIKPINFHEFPQEATDTLVFSKSFEWSYENEFRVLIQSNGLKAFDLNTVCSITFGARCPESTLEQAKSLMKQRSISPKLFKAELAANEFRLTFNELNI